MKNARTLTAMEKRRLMDLARVVPETLLLVGTTEEVFASIKEARGLLGEEKWGCDDADYPKWQSSSAGGDGHDVGGVPLNTTCSIFAGIRYDGMAPAPDLSADLQYDDAVPVHYFSDDLVYNDADSGLGYWSNLLTTALEDPLPKVYREITRLVSLHGEAGRVLFVCATRLGIQSGGGHNLGGQPDDNAARIGLRPDGDAAWKRWRDLRASVVRHAHDALLRLKAVAAAEDLIRWRSLESPLRNDWSSEERQLVRGARRSLDEVKDSVRLMRDAVVREYFETLMILNRT